MQAAEKQAPVTREISHLQYRILSKVDVSIRSTLRHSINPRIARLEDLMAEFRSPAMMIPGWPRAKREAEADLKKLVRRREILEKVADMAADRIRSSGIKYNMPHITESDVRLTNQ